MNKIICSLCLLALLSAAPLRADWKTWLHGGPSAPTPGKPDATAAKVSFAPGVAPDKPVLDFLLAFAEAARVHNGEGLKAFLSKKYTIENLPAGHDPVDLLMQAMVMIKAPNELLVTSIAVEGEDRVVKAEFHSATRPPKVRSFRFDAAGKLLGTDIFSLQQRSHFGG